MKVRHTASLAFAFVFVAAVTAWAITEQEVETNAQVLFDDYKDLETRIDDCPGGTCSGAQQILDDQDDLEVERTQLHSDRNSLQGCGCQTADSLISDVDGLADLLLSTTGDWNEQS